MGGLYSGGVTFRGLIFGILRYLWHYNDVASNVFKALDTSKVQIGILHGPPLKNNYDLKRIYDIKMDTMPLIG